MVPLNLFKKSGVKNHPVHTQFAAWERQPKEPAIRFHAVEYWVFSEEPILKDVTFQIDAGGSFIILGGSGAGKSTILRLALGLIKPNRGEIYVAGFNISRMTETELIELRQHIGIVFQEGALFDSLTLLENVEFPLIEMQHIRESEARRRALETLALVDLDGHEDKYPSELSGGMKRRGGIARALVTQPAILLYDEPTTGLDPITSRTIVDMIVKLRDIHGVTSVVVTHDLDSAFRIAQCRMTVRDGGLVEEKLAMDDPHLQSRFIVLKDGEMVFQGDLNSLLHSGHPYVEAFLGSFAQSQESVQKPSFNSQI